MDQDGSEHNICSNREGLCPGKKQHGASGWKKIFQHGKEPLRSKDSVSQYCNKKVAVSFISRYIKTDVNGNVSQDGIWSNIGVVVQSNNEQSYIGITIRIKNYYK